MLRKGGLEWGRGARADRFGDRARARGGPPVVVLDQLAPEDATAYRKSPHVAEDLHDQAVRARLQNGNVKLAIQLVGVGVVVVGLVDVFVHRLEPSKAG